ncbi:MAG: hypothetical protein M3063_06250, partial [Actinomycetota bacterium]|nr:hypothetical protein [Actinomycetota bacterium]
ATALTVAVGLAGCGSSAHPAAGSPATTSGIGALPSFLPKSSLTDQTLHATVARPALATQGEAVDVQIGKNEATANVGGPAVPAQGLVPVPATTLCTWTVTVTGTSGTTPLALAAFSVRDQGGRVSRPALVPGAAAPPPAVRAGQTVTFKLTDTLVPGEGLMRWSPVANQIEVSWDFVVEID